MKTFIPQTGGHDLRLDDFVFMQQGYTEALAGIISTFAPEGNCILSGMEESYTYGVSLLGGGVRPGYYSYTPGYIAFKPYGGESEVFKFVTPTFTYSSGMYTMPPIDGLADVPGTPHDVNRYLKIVDVSAGSPSDPVPYEDTTNKNVHFLRTMTMKWFEPGVDMPGVDGILYSEIDETNAVYRSAAANGAIPWTNTNRRGIIEEFYGYPFGEENLLFDAQGLGKYRMKGYAICNGSTHNIPNFGSYATPDLRGKFTLMPVAGMFSVTTPTSPYVPNNWDPSTSSWSGPLTAGVRLGIAAYNIIQDNLPAYTLPALNLAPHNHALPTLAHTHNVTARKVGAAGTSSDRDFYVVALGDSVNRHHGADGTDTAGSTVGMSGYDLSGGSGLPDNHFGTPRQIPGELVPGVSPYVNSAGLYSGTTGIDNGDIPGQGFVGNTDANPNFGTPASKLTDLDGLNGSTALSGTVDSGGSNIPLLNLPPAYTMIKVIRLW